MEHYAGIDVSLESASLCVVDATGRIIREAKVASEPDVLIAWFRGLEFAVTRIGLEAGPLSQWLYAGMREAGLPVELLETRHVRDAFKAMPVKTDRKDARGIAQLMRLGWFRPVHCKSLPAQEVRALLAARKVLQTKNRDIEMSLRGVLRGFGLKVGQVSKGRYEARIRELVVGHPMLEPVAAAMLLAATMLAYLYLLPAEFMSYARSLLAATFSFSNFYLAASSGYFMPAASTLPLLHTWSLAIEEQFYIFLPLFVLLVHRLWRRGLWLVLLAATLLSLALDRKSTRLNSSHRSLSRMPSSA